MSSKFYFFLTDFLFNFVKTEASKSQRNKILIIKIEKKITNLPNPWNLQF